MRLGQEEDGKRGDGVRGSGGSPVRRNLLPKHQPEFDGPPWLRHQMTGMQIPPPGRYVP